MALVDTVLENKLKAIFAQMNGEDETKNDAWMAKEIAKAIDEQIKTAEITTQIPATSVIVQVSGGSGAPAVGVQNPMPLPITQVSVS
jgi:hypothetical protein